MCLNHILCKTNNYVFDGPFQRVLNQKIWLYFYISAHFSIYQIVVFILFLPQTVEGLNNACKNNGQPFSFLPLAAQAAQELLVTAILASLTAAARQLIQRLCSTQIQNHDHHAQISCNTLHLLRGQTFKTIRYNNMKLHASQYSNQA